MASFNLLVLLLLFPLLDTAQAAEPPYSLCNNDSKYTSNSAYESNLKLLLSSLSLNSTNYTFSTATNGSITDRTYGLFLCRGDVNASVCHDCVQNAVQGATQNVLQLCPSSKQVTVWYDTCELRYSDFSFFTSFDNTEYLQFPNISDATDDPDMLKYERELMKNISYHAAYNSSLMFATGKMSYRDQTAIYGLVQCTRDLSKDYCYMCLEQMIEFHSPCCGKHLEGRILSKSCNVRNKGYKFFEGEPTISLVPLPSSASVPSPLPQPPASTLTGNDNGKGNRNIIIISIVISVVLAFIVIFAVCIFLRRRSATNRRGMANPEDVSRNISRPESLYFDLSILKVATANFSDVNKLGQGGFGAVYKGKLPNGQDIAVKRLSADSKQGIQELKNELLLVAKLQHRNLVRLRGVCLEEGEKLLVYEYMPNGSLDKFLFDPIKHKELNWERRFKIIGGIARGLLYLHEESHLKVIHRDLKASNVLLDANMKPKISDFGLARLFGGDETHAVTGRVVGTYGYMAPEYARRGRFSTKLDVYSYGILVLEIMTGRKNSTFKYDSESGLDLLSYTWTHWRSGTALEIIDPSLGEDYSRHEVFRCIQIGLLCSQEVPTDRPSMSSVFLMLNSPSMPLPDPLPPAYLVGLSMLESDVSSKVSSQQSYIGSTDRSSASSIGSSQMRGPSIIQHPQEINQKGKERVDSDLMSNRIFNRHRTHTPPSRLSQTAPAGRPNRN